MNIKKIISLISVLIISHQIFAQKIEVINGTISPQTFTVGTGSSQRFTFNPFNGYTLDSLIINGINIGNDSAQNYTLSNIQTTTTMRVVFRLINATSIRYTPIFERVNLPDSFGQYITYIDTTAPVNNGIADFVDSNLWDNLFPFRANWVTDSVNWDWLSPNKVPKLDFYSLSSLLQAAQNLSTLRVLIETRCNTNYQRITRFDLRAGTSKVVFLSTEFNSNLPSSSYIDTQWVNFNEFLNVGTLNTRKRELCAFLANVSHETTGGWATAPRGRFSWGLYFKSESGIVDTTTGYRQADPYYPPRPNRGYFGRGPIQISYNFNYGLCSSMLFGDVAIKDSATNLLLNNPGWVIWNGTNAWMTAIWFWMTPQYPKPSSHQAMIPGELRDTTNGFGMGATVNIINGGVECGGTTTLEQVVDRLGFYQRYCDYFKVSYELYGGYNINNCTCNGLRQYMINWGNSCSAPTSYFILPNNVKTSNDQNNLSPY